MKITKTKEVITEQIELKLGTYYFKCDNDIYYKMIIEEYCDDGIDYVQESVEYFSDVKGIRIRQDVIFSEEELPYKFSAFIRGVSGKKISAKEYETEKDETIKRLL